MTALRIYASDGKCLFHGTDVDLAKALGERERYRNGLLAIQDALENGRVCDDVAWYSTTETLFDFVDELLHPSEPAAIGDLFKDK